MDTRLGPWFTAFLRAACQLAAFPSILASHMAPDRRLLDARVYLAALRAMAQVDGLLHPKERAFLDSQARDFDIALSELPSLEALLRTGPFPEPETAAAIVRDVIFLAHLDGDYQEPERARALSIAELLGVGPAFANLQQDVVRRLSQDPLQPPPLWFRAIVSDSLGSHSFE